MKSNFVKTTLESYTHRELAIEDFVGFLIACCAGADDRINSFLEKWESPYGEQLKKIAVAYNKGSWTPRLCSESEINEQSSWKTFVLEYDKKFVSCSVKSEEEAHKNFQPLNFEELVKMTFWKSLYDTFGHKMMRFIFEKCIVIFTVEPEVYVIITSSKTCLPLKMVRKRKPPRIKPIVATKALPNPDTIKHQTLVQCSSTFNPNIVTPTCQSEAVKPSLKRKEIELSPLENEYAVAIPRKRFCSQKNSVPTFDSSIIRWITPKVELLQTIISEREKTKQTHNISSSALMLTGVKEYSFLAIIKDSFFTESSCPLNIIGKTSVRIRPNGSLPNEFNGLRLPKDFKKGKEKVILNAYRISETLAKKYKIRITPRKRNKKKVKTVDAINKADSEEKMEELEINDCDRESSVFPQFSFLSRPFNPNQPLSIDTILYNKSSWSKLPSSHFAIKILTMSESDGINVLMSEMLQSPLEEIQSYMSKFPDELKELKSISTFMISFHKRVKDIHKLTKSCLMHWILRHIQKGMLKGLTKLHRKNCLAHKRFKKIKIASQESMEIEQSPSDICVSTSSNVLQIGKSTSIQDPSGSLESEKSRSSSLCNIPFNLRHLSQFFPSDSDGLSKSSHSKMSPGLTQSMLEFQEKGKSALFQQLKEAIPHSCILSTLSQILHLSGAGKLLGSKRNKRAFLSFVKKSIMMGGLRSSLQLSQLMSSLHPEDCVWINLMKNVDAKTIIFPLVVQWLFSKYVLQLIKTSFYGTETGRSRNQIVFYLRETWKSLTDKIKDRFIKKSTLRAVDECKPVNSRLRLLPKQNNTIRPLVSFNESMKNTFNQVHFRLLINYINSNSFPQGFQDANGVRVKWSKFWQSYHKNKKVPLFYARADIKDAYGSVKLKLLKDILLNSGFACGQGQYLLKRFYVMSVGSQIPKIVCSLVNENDRTNWHSSIFTRPCIIQDCRKDGILDAKAIILSIVNAINPNVVKLGKHNFEFEYGLPQGWIMSQHLCNLYYGSMEERYLSEFLERPGELFIRSVDDYFYISANPRRVAKFCNIMKNGISEYNCSLNVSKCATNLYVSSAISSPKAFCDWINFCGWKFCLETGHVRRDFTSYAGQDISCTLTFKLHERTTPDEFIFKRMGMVAPLRLSSLFFDPVVNCRRRIVMNVFEASLMMAFRFYAMCRVLYPNTRCLSEDIRINAFLSTVYRSAKCMSQYIIRGNLYFYPHNPIPLCNQVCQNFTRLIKRKVQKQPSTTVNVPLCTSTPITEIDLLNTPLSRTEVFFLVYHAFILKLKKHSQVFKDSLLPKLQKACRFQRSRLSEMQYSFLVETVGFKMPEDFLAMKK